MMPKCPHCETNDYVVLKKTAERVGTAVGAGAGAAAGAAGAPARAEGCYSSFHLLL